MAILAKQLVGMLGELGRVTDEPGRLTRTFLSPAMKRANALVAGLMKEAGLAVRVDAGDSPRDLYDACSGTFLVRGARGATAFAVPAGGAVLLVLPPAGGKETREGGKLLVDGSILAEDALRWDWAQDGTAALFIRMRAKAGTTVPFENGLFPLPGYLRMLIRTFMTSISREYVRDAYWSMTLIVETDDITPLEFDLDPTQKDQLYQAGYEQTMRYLPIKLGNRLSKPSLAS